ncbi:hypothetical protein NPIL_546511 [Nephila pilipes]|uniref:Uncharacterized protein n=1 Tax=Nephila pilipes TaxID=299642 RepID=A0A8X6MBS0_NEPPI|nr:hypothetical protein NPIL_546511 [Nephila pilipes]
MALEKEKDFLKSIQSHTVVATVKEEQGEINREYAIHLSNGLEMKSASEDYKSKRESSLTSLGKEDCYSDAKSTIFEKVCIGEVLSEIAECKTLLHDKKCPKFQVRKEKKESACSSAGYFADNNLTPLGYIPEQIHMLSSDEGNPLYRNVPIGELTRECVTNKTLIYKREAPKLKGRSERGKPNYSASLCVKENNSKSLRNTAHRNESYYSDEESTIFENVRMGELSSEIAECKTLLYEKKYPKFQARKESDELSCCISFENDQSDSISVFSVDLQPWPLNPTYCNLDEEREHLSRMSIMDSQTTLLNISPQTTNIPRWMLRLRRVFRIIRGKLAKFFDREM